MLRSYHLPNDIEIRPGIAANVFLPTKESNTNLRVPVCKVSSDDKTVAAVVAFSAYDQNTPACDRAGMPLEYIHKCPTCIFHQHDTRNAVVRDGLSVELLHQARCREKLHLTTDS
jgi:hypothetical protein